MKASGPYLKRQLEAQKLHTESLAKERREAKIPDSSSGFLHLRDNAIQGSGR